jgi:5-methylcytosine-specific restriction protein A
MFEIGKIYKRKDDIHFQLGGQRQGGISTSSGHPVALLFTSESGSEFGYEDKFHSDGTFWYTGEGQVGDMKWCVEMQPFKTTPKMESNSIFLNT